MRVLVTRPAAQAADWVDRLRAQGIDAAALPLIAIGPAADGAAVRETWAQLAELRLVVFVSPNAADQFFAQRLEPCHWPAHLLAASPGPGTTQALLGLGLTADRIVAPAADSAQFDSEALWLALQRHDWQGARVLIVRGEGGGRDWLADALRQAGAQVASLAAYRRTAPVFDAAGWQLLHAAVDAAVPHVWLFSSSEAIDHLEAILKAGSGGGDGRESGPGSLGSPVTAGSRIDADRAWAIATHPRIAARARRIGFTQVSESRPELAAVVACIQSCRP